MEIGRGIERNIVPGADEILLRYISSDRQGEWGRGIVQFGGKSRLHNWSPKLVFCLYNMALNNAYKMYTALVKEHTPKRRFF